MSIAIPIAIILGYVAGYVGYYKLIPYHSAATRIPEAGATLHLAFYLTEYQHGDSGRYLTAINASGDTARVMMSAYDWAHWARTSLYVTDDGDIAVLGPNGADFRLGLKPLQFRPELPGSFSDYWRYLGAFDFGEGRSRKRALRFFSAQEQPECIPMMSSHQPSWERLPRGSWRRERCRMH